LVEVYRFGSNRSSEELHKQAASSLFLTNEISSSTQKVELFCFGVKEDCRHSSGALKRGRGLDEVCFRSFGHEVFPLEGFSMEEPRETRSSPA
jgi:hypothetical protein